MLGGAAASATPLCARHHVATPGATLHRRALRCNAVPPGCSAVQHTPCTWRRWPRPSARAPSSRCRTAWRSPTAARARAPAPTPQTRRRDEHSRLFTPLIPVDSYLVGEDDVDSVAQPLSKGVDARNCTHAHARTHACTHTHAHAHARTHAHARASTHTLARARTHTRIRMDTRRRHYCTPGQAEMLTPQIDRTARQRVRTD
jgi:hypothetical protein